MKKKLLFGVCLIVVLAFAGCVSTALAFVYDPGIPEDQMSFLWVPNYIKVKQFDGKAVDWIAPALSMSSVQVGVPSGEYTFVIDTEVTGRNIAGIPTVRDKSFTKNFEAGKGYQLILQNGEITLIDLE